VLYKYFPRDRLVAGDKLLLRFTQPGDLNDPFEMHPSFDLMSKADIAALPKAPGSQNMHVLTPEALQVVISQIQPGLMAVMKESSGVEGAYLLDNNRLAQATFDEKVGVLCLTEKPDSLPMWAHYAENHRGFVLQFDECHKFFGSTNIDGQDFALTKVEYNDKRPVLSCSTMNSPSVYYRKSPDWSYECEWRLIKPLRSSTRVEQRPRYPLHLFSVPADAITGVIIGAATSQEDRDKLLEFFERPELKHATIYQASLSKDEYRLMVYPSLDGLPTPDAFKSRVCEAR